MEWNHKFLPIPRCCAWCPPPWPRPRPLPSRCGTWTVWSAPATQARCSPPRRGTPRSPGRRSGQQITVCSVPPSSVTSIIRSITYSPTLGQGAVGSASVQEASLVRRWPVWTRDTWHVTRDCPLLTLTIIPASDHNLEARSLTAQSRPRPSHHCHHAGEEPAEDIGGVLRPLKLEIKQF